MRSAARTFALCCVSCCLSIPSYSQAVGLAAIGAPNADPSYAQLPPIDISTLPADYSINSLTIDAVTGAAIGGAAGNASITADTNEMTQPESSCSSDESEDSRPNLPTVDGLNTLATFDRAFVAQAGPSVNRDFRFTMIGNDPKIGGTTVYPANLAEVALRLLNANGSVFKTVSYAPFETPTLQSPNFVPLHYASGNGLEFADAVHRAEFFNTMKHNWHTVLCPHVVNRVTITVPFFVNVQLPNGTIVQARSYFTGTAGDGSTFVLMLQPLFNFFFFNEVVSEINLGNFTTNSINTTLFPNTFLFSLNVNNPNVPGGCCTLGFHTYFYEPGTFPQPRWISQFVSWISPGIFGGGFQDVTALSHETSESFDDPFLSNSTPIWQFPGQPANSKVCQGNLEVGDPVEVLANATTAIQVNQFLFHPQNMALYQWFEMGTTSNAINGAFSFPDQTVLPHSAIPCPM
jgi:hypothetical protein